MHTRSYMVIINVGILQSLSQHHNYVKSLGSPLMEPTANTGSETIKASMQLWGYYNEVKMKISSGISFMWKCKRDDNSHSLVSSFMTQALFFFWKKTLEAPFSRAT